MKKIGIGLLVLGVIFATTFFITSNKKDSTGICFIGKRNFKQFRCNRSVKFVR